MFGKIRAKILSTHKNLPAPTPMVLTMQLPQHSTWGKQQSVDNSII